jgi:hypothetical protein
MQDAISFSALCPTCKNEVKQGPRDPGEIRRLLSEDCLSFYCELSDLEWEPSHQELANVEQILACPVNRVPIDEHGPGCVELRFDCGARISVERYLSAPKGAFLLILSWSP